MLELIELDQKELPRVREALESCITIKRFEKGEVLLRAGEHSSLGYMVRSGLMRSYTIDEKGKEHIFMFAPEGWVISDIQSQSSGEPARLFIDCLEPTEVEVIDRVKLRNSGLEGVMGSNPDKLMRRIGVLQRRVIMLMSATALDRYQHFVETYPNMVNRVPQKMIASYLGTTPEALSKIKSEQLRNG